MPPEFPVDPQPAPTLFFFGVTTGRSSSRRMFPAWAEILGLGGTRLVGLDLPINGPPEVYRRTVHQIKHDPLSLGGIVTTHKINTLNAARDLFDNLTPDAELCGEVSAITKRNSRLTGHATDPACSGQAMRAFIPPDHWAASGADVLCLGAGGSAVAIAVYFSTRAAPDDRPRRLIAVDRSRPRLDSLRALVETRLPPSGIAFEYVENADPAANDRRMGDLPDGSLVINATGMGKDTPGSPLTDAGRFPRGGFAWDLNYRGELNFLRQAHAQAASRGLHVEDGWMYFLLGWSTIVGQVFDVPIPPPVFERLVAAAEAVR